MNTDIKKEFTDLFDKLASDFNDKWEAKYSDQQIYVAQSCVPQMNSQKGYMTPYVQKEGAKYPSAYLRCESSRFPEELLDRAVVAWKLTNDDKSMMTSSWKNNPYMKEWPANIQKAVAVIGSETIGQNVHRFNVYHRDKDCGPSYHYHTLFIFDKSSQLKDKSFRKKATEDKMAPVTIRFKKVQNIGKQMVYLLFGPNKQFVGTTMPDLVGAVRDFKRVYAQMQEMLHKHNLQTEDLRDVILDPTKDGITEDIEIVNNEFAFDGPLPGGPVAAASSSSPNHTPSSFLNASIDQGTKRPAEEEPTGSEPKKVDTGMDNIVGEIFADQKTEMHEYKFVNMQQATLNHESDCIIYMVKRNLFNDKLIQEYINDRQYKPPHNTDYLNFNYHINKGGQVLERIMSKVLTKAMNEGVHKFITKEFNPEAVKAFWNLLDLNWQKVFVSVSLLVSDRTRQKLGTVYIHGVPDCGKTYMVREGLSFIQPQQYNVAGAGTFQFAELNKPNLVCFMDDQNLILNNDEEVEKMKNVMARQQAQINAKYKSNQMMRPCPLVILTNKVEILILNSMGSSQKEALEARMFYKGEVTKNFTDLPQIDMKSLQAVWKVCIEAALQMDTVKVPFNMDIFDIWVENFNEVLGFIL